MKKAIELLEVARNAFLCVATDDDRSDYNRDEGLRLLKEALVELKSPPCWETPEQREKRTGEKWPDAGAVYCRGDNRNGIWREWIILNYKCAKGGARIALDRGRNSQIVCATEAGPPPDGWRPEEDKQDFDILPPPGENLFDGFGSHGDIRGEKPLTSPDG